MKAMEVRNILADYMRGNGKLAGLIAAVVTEAENDRPDGAYQALASFDEDKPAANKS